MGSDGQGADAPLVFRSFRAQSGNRTAKAVRILDEFVNKLVIVIFVYPF